MRDEVKSFILKNGDKYIIYRGSNIRTYDQLPKGIYRTQTDMFGNIFLIAADDFSLPEKIYGHVQMRAQRIINTYEERQGSTGVLLSGEKGAGKTMLAKYISMEALEKGYSTIICGGDAVLSGAFISFMESLVEPAIIMMDEFEKMFEDTESQNHLLSLFDGVSEGKKLYILTANDPQKINDYFKARPGRLFYNFRYNKLDKEVIEEVLTDNEVPQEFATALIEYVDACETFNFDSLMAIVEEHKRYQLTFDETIEGLNIVQKPLYYNDETYNISVYCEGMKNPIVIAMDYKLNLSSGHHYYLSDTNYNFIKNHPENDEADVKIFIENLTNGNASDEKSFKEHIQDEGMSSLFINKKGKVGQKENRTLICDLSGNGNGIMLVVEEIERKNWNFGYLL